ncbi:hypothetical protein L873DRAFT_1789067 [Choiromyces venosus 120613-1]|uniref:Uncharacterized protein n=1 Tax=Choiromyces venosus 120613-1 TaxID=1336337 RepID=A0A3N4JQ64_9PEZI|nr:hypothetical protein L873DRAFT_1789067 [Choiromyces venosus 120613-1]
MFTLRAARISRGLPPRVRGLNTNTHKYNFADAVADADANRDADTKQSILKPHNTEPELPTEGSIAWKIINPKKVKNNPIPLLLKVLPIGCKNGEIYKVQLGYLGERMDSRFKQLRDEAVGLSQEMGDSGQRTDRGFQKTDCWMFLLIVTFILKGGFDTINSQGWFE